MIVWPEVPCIPTTLYVVSSVAYIQEAVAEHPHWTVCAAMDTLTATRFDRIILADNVHMGLHPEFYVWLRRHLRERLKPGGTLRKMSHVDTISDMC